MVSLAICISLGLWLSWLFKGDWKGKHTYITCGVIMGLIWYSFLFVLFSTNPGRISCYDIGFDKVELLSLEKTNTFFLRIPGEQQLYYQVRYKIPGDGENEIMIPARRVNVYEKEGPGAYMARIDKKPYHSFWFHVLIIPFEIKKLYEWNYAIYVPIGTS